MAKGYSNPFVAGGALRKADLPVYVIRDQEKEVANLLRGGKFVSLAESRQQGKTSLINRLPQVLGKRTPVIVIKAVNYLPETPQQWYQAIGGAIYRGLCDRPGLLPRRNKIKPPANQQEWGEFLTSVALTVSAGTVIALDEIDVIKFDGSDHFYSVIRSVRDELRGRIAFVLAGCFHPLYLVTNKDVSPFNGAPRVRLPDFTYTEVAQLAGKLPPHLPRPKIAQEVFHWAGGHPYMTQFLLRKIAGGDAHRDIESLVADFVAEDALNLPRIRTELDKQENLDLRSTLDQILDGARPGCSETAPYSPSTRLGLLGLVAPDKEHLCRIRNRIYEVVLRGLKRQHEVFISYRSEDAAWADLLLKELEKGDTRCFFAPRNLAAGANFPRELRGSVASSRCLALLVNRKSLVECRSQRDWVRIEVEHAIQSKVTVIPVMIQDCPDLKAYRLPASMKTIAKAHALRLTLESVAAVAAAIRKKVRGET